MAEIPGQQPDGLVVEASMDDFADDGREYSNVKVEAGDYTGNNHPVAPIAGPVIEKGGLLQENH